MPATNAEIGSRVRALLELKGMGQRELATFLDIDPSALSRALTGERMFKAREIALVAEIFGVSTSAVLEGPSETERSVTMAARRSLDNRTAVEMAVDRAGFYVELASLVDGTNRAKAFELELADVVPWRQGQGVADQVLRQCELGREPLPGSMHQLAALVEERLGIGVALEPLEQGMDGLSVAGDRLDLALVSTSTATVRQRWTLAHECAHLILGDAEDLLVDESVWSRKTLEETRANAFAAAFLMPDALLKTEWERELGITEQKVARLLDMFHVSLDALAFRLHNVGLVDASGRDAIRSMHPYVSVIRNQGTRQSEGTWLPTELTTAVVEAYGRGKLGVRWLAALVQLDPEDLLKRLKPSDEEVEVLECGDESLAV